MLIISEPQERVLNAIRTAQGDVTIGSIAKSLGLSKTPVAKTLSKLKKRKLITQRKVHFHLTDYAMSQTNEEGPNQ